MTESGGVRPMIVFVGRTEFEAQMARDLLTSAMIPVLHVPGLTTGLFGMRQDTRVAVPADQVEAAVELLRAEGFDAGPQDRPRGLREFQGAARQAFPSDQGRDWRSVVPMIVLGLAAAYLLLRGCGG